MACSKLVGLEVVKGVLERLHGANKRAWYVVARPTEAVPNQRPRQGEEPPK